jgi:hypothetical protein
MSKQNLVDRRQCERSASSEPVTLTIDSDAGPTSYKALAVDISPNGARLQTDINLYRGQHVTVTRQNGVTQAVSSQVVWARGAEADQTRQVGVMFLQPARL